MRNSRGQFEKGFHHNQIWDIDSIFSELKNAVKITVENFGFAPPFLYFRNHPEYRKITCAIANRKMSRSRMYKKALDELGFDYPEKKSGYYTDGNVFRGFYEFVAFCFMKSWGLNVVGNPQVFENYLADGYLVDYNIYWEHWGGLNKRNNYKKTQYNCLDYNLISTYDEESSKHGIDWFYFHLKNLLIQNGVVINFIENEKFSPLDLIKGKVLKLTDIYKNVKEFCGETKPKLHTLTSSLQHQICRYFGKYSNFIKYANKHFNETWEYQEKTFDCNDVEYCVNIMKDFIVELKRFPTASEMRKQGFQSVLSAMPKHGGIESFKRNLHTTGDNFHLIYSILGDSAPYDKLYDFNDDEVLKWAVDYITKKLGSFPKYQGQLRKHWNDDVCRFFILSMRPNSGNRYTSWGDFQKRYFNDTSSSDKKFLGIIPYEQYKEIRFLLENDKYTKSKVIEITNSGWGTLGRIKNKHKRFTEYSNRYEKECVV